MIHLAMAVILLQQLQAKAGHTVDYFDILWNEQVLAWLVTAGAYYERLIRHFRDRLPPINLDTLISVSLVR